MTCLGKDASRICTTFGYPRCRGLFIKKMVFFGERAGEKHDT